VSIRGSERITSWVHQGGNGWMVELDNAFFGTFNPFREQISGSWLYYGGHYHLGEVYLNLRRGGRPVVELVPVGLIERVGIDR
jgi:hypothetical protein